MLIRHVLITVTLLAVTAPLTAQDIRISGQFRERSEADARSFVTGTSTDLYHLLRMRLRADAEVTEAITVAVEVQDARRFGQTGSTMNGDAPAFDLRQGYAEVRDIGGSFFSAKLGRQVLAYANERFLGGIDWSNVGQSFDAAVLRADFGDVTIDALGAGIVRRPNDPYQRDTYLLGTWVAWKPSEVDGSLQGFFLHDTPQWEDYRQFRYTAGLYTAGSALGFDASLEGAYQFGDLIFSTPELLPMEIKAVMFGGRLGYTFEGSAALRAGIGYDRLSGDDPANQGTYGSFHTLYGTNHMYYGYMDYFLDIPASTEYLGLQDVIFQASFKPHPAITVALDGHYFKTTVRPSRVEGMPADASSTIGYEVDLTLKAKILQALNMSGGFSAFFAHPDRVLLTGDRDTATWAYLMAIITF